MNDYRGLSVTGASPQAVAHFERALVSFQTFTGDPFAALDAALAESPDFTLARVLKANLLLVGTEPAGVALGREALQMAQATSVNAREARHLAALQHLADWNFRDAAAELDSLLQSWPRDVMALQVVHLVDFLRADALQLRARPARALAAWHTDDIGYHAVLGMHAFGLEECGEYRAAEEAGLAALEREPRDSWAHHAVAHVHEMQGRPEEGLHWMKSREAAWSTDNFFAVHNWWHRALFHLDLEQRDQALALYDQRIRATRSGVLFDMVDASGLLWRLMLRGTDAGKRWQELADAWAPHAGSTDYPFNAWHAVMATAGAQRWQDAEAIVQALTARAQSTDEPGQMAAQAGLPIAQAFLAYARGDFARCVDLLLPLRPLVRQVGGSHAQRDLVDLTLLDAARRSQQLVLVRTLAEERLTRKPHNTLNLRYRDAAQALSAVH